MLFKKTSNFFIVLFFLALLSCSSKEDEYIDTVKNSNFEEFPTITIGGFLDNKNLFSQTEWKFNENDFGEITISFVGQLNLNKYKALGKLYSFEVVFDFVFDANSKNFNIRNQKYFLIPIESASNLRELLGINDRKYEHELELKELKNGNYPEEWERTVLTVGIEHTIKEYSIDRLKKIINSFNIKNPNNIIVFSDDGEASAVKHAFSFDSPWTVKHDWAWDGNSIVSKITKIDSIKGVKLYKFINGMYNIGFTTILPNEKEYFDDLYYDLNKYKTNYLGAFPEKAKLVENFMNLIDKFIKG